MYHNDSHVPPEPLARAVLPPGRSAGAVAAAAGPRSAPAGAPIAEARRLGRPQVLSARPATAYALVTAAYNEAALIRRTIDSVAAQSVPPAVWLIVDDGSTDGTAEVARAQAADHPYIDVVRIDRDAGRSFVSKVYAVREGFKRVLPHGCEFIGNLDADLSFDPTYFEGLLEKFAVDPGLGIGGGWLAEELDGVYRPRRFNSRHWVPHAVQLLRRSCYDAIGDYLPLPYGGEDTWAVVSARMQGWRAESFPDLPVKHHRRTASAGGLLRNRIRTRGW